MLCCHPHKPQPRTRSQSGGNGAAPRAAPPGQDGQIGQRCGHAAPGRPAAVADVDDGPRGRCVFSRVLQYETQARNEQRHQPEAPGVRAGHEALAARQALVHPGAQPPTGEQEQHAP